ncbi:MAG: PAS domain-containing sensor histidine kinase [Sedimenticola sp.]
MRMLNFRTSRQSLYVTLGIIIVSTVILIMSSHSAYTYVTTKQKIIEEMKHSSRLSIVALEKNVGSLIMSYAVNEYDKLVFTEMERRNNFAIVVEDYNMGKIVGRDSYVSGKIRDTEWNIIDYAHDNSEQNRLLEQCFYSDKYEITNPSGDKLGTISIYITDDSMNDELNKIIISTSINTLALSLFLILSLFITIRLFILMPLSNIVAAINNSDADGIPIESIQKQGPKEISILSNTMNNMISAIRDSRIKLQEQHESLQLEKERFQLAIDGTDNGLWDWDLQTDAVIHSARFETMLGYDEGELPDTIECWAGLLHPDDAEQAHQKVNDYLATKGKGVYESTFRMRTKSGEWHWITGRGKALFANDGTPLRFVGFNADITDWKQMQALMIQTEKMMSVGGLAAGMAHELNNPLGGILQGLQNVRRRLSPNLEKNRSIAVETGIDLDKVKAYMEKRDIPDFLMGIEESGERAAKIVNNMLMFSHKSDETKKIASVNEIIEKTLALASVDYNLKEQFDFHNITITRDYDQSNPQILCIASEIQQVLLNIFHNAAYAFSDTQMPTESQVINVRTFKRSDMLCIEVEDNGPGMEETVSKRIFEPFYTTKDVGEGTGLGLSISYFIVVDQHGGTLSVNSAQGQGTKFLIELPLHS